MEGLGASLFWFWGGGDGLGLVVGTFVELLFSSNLIDFSSCDIICSLDLINSSNFLFISCSDLDDAAAVVSTDSSKLSSSTS